MREIADGVFVETGYRGANVGLILTGGGALLVDTPMFPHEARDWLGAVSSIAEHEISYIISTDYHAPRILGNWFFSAPVIAHELAWGELKARGQTILQRQIDYYNKREPEVAAALADVEVVFPEIAVVDKLAIHIGDRLVSILHFGGHTPATLGVYVIEAKVLFAGDLVVAGRHPDLGQAQSEEWLEALDRISAMNVDVIIPGSGEPCDLSPIPPLKAYIQEMRQLVGEAHKGGASRREAVEKVRSVMVDRFPFPPREKDITTRRIRASIERVYEEARKGQV